VGEPLFYLLSIGVGLGRLVGHVAGPGGRPVTFAEFVAPALLATSSMNGAIFDSTYNVFFRLKYAKLYDAALSTPMRAADVALGEITWALIRGALYAFAFTVVMLVMGLLRSPWAAGVLPAALLTGFAFAATGMAATTFMRSWQDFEYVTLVSLPLFLHPALPVGRADARARARRGRPRAAVARGLPRRHGRDRPVHRRPPGGPPVADLKIPANRG
jgi:lipooligosaccharide transport system permease protein